MGIMMAKHGYNTQLNAYRRHTSPANLENVQTAYKTVYPCEEPILEPVDHQMQQQHQLSRGMEKN